MPAFEWAIKNGYRIVETDVDFTKDHIPVCLHDSSIDRTSDGSGECSSFTLDELKKYDFGYEFYIGVEHDPVEISTLEDFLSLCKANNEIPYIDIALQGFSSEQVKIIYDIAKRTGVYEIALFDVDFIEFEMLASLDKNLHVVIDPINTMDDANKAVNLVNRVEKLYAAIPMNSFSKELTQYLHDNGCSVLTWSINNVKDIKQYKSDGCDLIFTDSVVPRQF